jgi:hypothetical protein
MAGAKELWHAHAPPKVKFFFLARLTRSTLDGRTTDATWIQPSANCAFCDQLDETTDHLLCSYVFAREVWSRLLSAMTSIATPPHPTSTLLDWWLSVRSVMSQPLHRSFDSLVLLVTWCLWKEQNRRTFDH